MDFIMCDEKMSGFDFILVVMCYLTKMAHFIATMTTADAVETAKLFIQNIIRLHGSPKVIVSDRGPKFISKSWKHRLKYLKTQLRFRTSFHPETDEQNDRLNRTV
jgi:hypothetical protein